MPDTPTTRNCFEDWAIDSNNGESQGPALVIDSQEQVNPNLENLDGTRIHDREVPEPFNDDEHSPSFPQLQQPDLVIDSQDTNHAGNGVVPNVLTASRNHDESNTIQEADNQLEIDNEIPLDDSYNEGSNISPLALHQDSPDEQHDVQPAQQQNVRIFNVTTFDSDGEVTGGQLSNAFFPRSLFPPEGPPQERENNPNGVYDVTDFGSNAGEEIQSHQDSTGGDLEENPVVEIGIEAEDIETTEEDNGNEDEVAREESKTTDQADEFPQAEDPDGMGDEVDSLDHQHAMGEDADPFGLEVDEDFVERSDSPPPTRDGMAGRTRNARTFEAMFEPLEPEPETGDNWPTKTVVPGEMNLQDYIEGELEELTFMETKRVLGNKVTDEPTVNEETPNNSWKKHSLAGLRFWFDFDSFTMCSKYFTKILESIGTKDSPKMELLTTFNFTEVGNVSTRLMMRRPGGLKYRNSSNGRYSTYSDISCNPQVLIASITTSRFVTPLFVRLVIISPEETRRGNGLPRWTVPLKDAVNNFFEIVRCVMMECPFVTRNRRDSAYVQAWTKFTPRVPNGVKKKHKVYTTRNTISIEQGHTFFSLWEKMMPNILSFMREYMGDVALSDTFTAACEQLRDNFFFFCSSSGMKAQMPLLGDIRADMSLLEEFDHQTGIENPEYCGKSHGIVPIVQFSKHIN